MKKSLCLSCTTLIAILLLLASCNMIVHQSPSEVIIAAYMAGNEGRYAATKKYFSSEFFNFTGGDFRAIASGMRASWERSTKNGTIERIEILSEIIRDTKANVHLVLHFKDGSKKKFSEPLIKEKGSWKITI